MSMAKLVRWLHKHTEYVMFPSKRTQPSLDQMPSFELQRHIRLIIHREKQKKQDDKHQRTVLFGGLEICVFIYQSKNVKSSKTQPVWVRISDL